MTRRKWGGGSGWSEIPGRTCARAASQSLTTALVSVPTPCLESSASVYDYSPEAVTRYLRTQQRIARWTADTGAVPQVDPYAPPTPAQSASAPLPRDRRRTRSSDRDRDRDGGGRRHRSPPPPAPLHLLAATDPDPLAHRPPARRRLRRPRPASRVPPAAPRPDAHSRQQQALLPRPARRVLPPPATATAGAPAPPLALLLASPAPVVRPAIALALAELRAGPAAAAALELVRVRRCARNLPPLPPGYTYAYPAPPQQPVRSPTREVPLLKRVFGFGGGGGSGRRTPKRGDTY
ncbi:hypothetical protein B0H11DRAFT_1941127 [Mycena galericulata]|nr:hypothetical protein B0H11DRAFT_1941127 [Mycena galericulata]